MLGQICTALLDAVFAQVRRPLTIIETGCAYRDQLEPNETDLLARSTLSIAKWADKHPCQEFVTIDRDLDHIRTCKLILSNAGVTHPLYMCGDADKILHTMCGTIDLLLLDSDSDAKVALDEFLSALAKMDSAHGIVLIDDAYKPAKVNKARLALPHAESLGFQWRGIGKQVAAIAVGENALPIIQAVETQFR